VRVFRLAAHSGGPAVLVECGDLEQGESEVGEAHEKALEL
jgi:hypothetical protein